MDISALVKSFGSHGVTAGLPVVLMFSLFTPEDEYLRHVAESQRGFIFDQIERARVEGTGPYKDSICRSLEETISALCAESPEDSVCEDRVMLLEQAGCR